MKLTNFVAGDNRSQGWQIAFLAAVAAIVVFAVFYWEGNQGFDLWDEGFLWYGAQRVLLGEVPIRDFMSYDPGRYYWVAAHMKLISSNGIMSMRFAAAVFQAMGIFTALLLLSSASNKRGTPFVVFSALVLVVWMYPLYKSFDISISIILIFGIALLFKNPTNSCYFFVGMLVGLIAVFGRNHGVYGIFAGLSTMIYFACYHKSASRFSWSFLVWVMGVVVGYSPVILMAVAYPGFVDALWRSIQFLFEIKATNLAVPVPWPWTVPTLGLFGLGTVKAYLLGAFFIAILVFPIALVVLEIWKKKDMVRIPPALLSSAVLSVPYIHYAYSRPDTLHLAMGIAPLVIGCLAWLATQKVSVKWIFSCLLFFAGLIVMAPLHPGWVCYNSQICVDTEVGEDRLSVHPNVPVELGFLKKLVERFAPNRESFLITPFWPGAYAALNRKSPTWEIYALFPRTAIFENSEIDRIYAANLAFVMIIDVALDGKEALRFRNTHPTINQYIYENFDRIQGYTPNDAYQLYIPKRQ